MQQPVAADDHDVAINAVALQQAGHQGVAQSLLKKFLAGAVEEGDSEDADTYSLPAANALENYDESRGIDYVPSSVNGQATSHSRGGSAATELLRKQLLGKRATNKTHGSPTTRTDSRIGQMSSVTTSKPQARRPRKEDSSDDEDGRYRVGNKSRKLANVDKHGIQSKPQVEKGIQHERVPGQQAGKGSKRVTSYLDQVLATRSAKQRKKKQQSFSDV